MDFAHCCCSLFFSCIIFVFRHNSDNIVSEYRLVQKIYEQILVVREKRELQIA